MKSWVMNLIDDDSLKQAHIESSRRLLHESLKLDYSSVEEENSNFLLIIDSLELALIDLLDDDEQINSLRKISAELFQLLRVLPKPEDPIEAGKEYLRLSCFGVLGDRGADASRLLRELPPIDLPINSPYWNKRTFATIIDVWLSIIRKDGWNDLDRVHERVVDLRKHQNEYEKDYLESEGDYSRTAAWELVALYHLAKAAELLAIYTTQGQVEGNYDIRQQLESQFDSALNACTRAELVELDNLTRLLECTSQQLVDNCIWTITRAVNDQVTQFVETLVSRERSKPIFEMLPPQRYTLREEGLRSSSPRSIVINLPTSSGKTFIAEFRILQALNQFENGWIAYLAPTHALVNQICTRLRKDFNPLKINVEKISPALEIDSLEAGLLTDVEKSSYFRVLVTTPEKLDLMLRGGWEQKINRPLSLVIVDEAHNLSQPVRGIKLELLLATINRECRDSQFLLLTPFINNATQISKWLSSDSNKSIEMSVDWNPNDRAIALSRHKKSNNGNYSLYLETLHTTRNTLHIPEKLQLSNNRPLGYNWSQINNNASKLAAVTAQVLKERGSVIVLVGKIQHTWSLANSFKHPDNKITDLPEDVKLVKRYIQSEFGDDFPLCDLLEYGIGVHHSGLSDETKWLMEWLFESGHIKILVATTTIAQGVNFPVTAVVMADYRYPYGKEMQPEEFWNLVGRAGRVDQGSVGIVALAATNEKNAVKLKTFVDKQVLSLNSTLIKMVETAISEGQILELQKLSYLPEWSAFLQYIVHSYRQIGNSTEFTKQIELILRGTLGFETLRNNNPDNARYLIAGVRAYADNLSGNAPLKLVDSTGFSLETIRNTLKRLRDERIGENIWDPNELFKDKKDLRKLMGILLDVSELRENLEAATGGWGKDGSRLADMVTDWVNGLSLKEMSDKYFANDKQGNAIDSTKAMSNCCRNIFGKLTQTAAWGLAALQTMTFGDNFDKLSETDQATLRNLPARVYYGVDTDEAIALRLLGVPRSASLSLSKNMFSVIHEKSLNDLRTELASHDSRLWTESMGKIGEDYYKIWKVLEGIA
ncbi:RNA helicase [Methanosarcina barkeri str. Wiesmoor]|uniref:RNA helicase n=2 Tax=Methanosarcina barkeri TaxID=2208 RepID=A0A0E3QIT4_METBA|nr:DEAD/DEAH box helicase [Methanosarcina barkeri]AKB49304.1 RNA helicase [Methanosarcina barkeri str. Wiesmoor]